MTAINKRCKNRNEIIMSVVINNRKIINNINPRNCYIHIYEIVLHIF